MVDKGILRRLETQRKEFDTLAELSKAMDNLPAIVDDDYPEMRHYYESHMRTFIEAIRANGRIETVKQVSMEEGLKYVSEQSTLRAAHWHGTSKPWSVLEWAGAMCGEAGEAANVAKKILREESGMQNGISTGMSTAQLNDKFGRELADTFLYLVLCAANRGINLGEYVVKVFNEKSEEYGFPERL